MSKMPSKRSLSFLSKSQFVRACQCMKSLYLAKYFPELRDELGSERQHTMEQGEELGLMAQELFAGGIEVPFKDMTYKEQVDMTAELLMKNIPIYEASFFHQDAFVKVDILNPREDVWDIYEVKMSTKQKDVYILDAAFQYYVLNGAGMKVGEVCVVIVDNEYVREGDIDPHKLFKVLNVTDEVLELQSFVAGKINAIRHMLVGAIPTIALGKHCDNPYTCDYREHCRKDLPENNIFELKGRGTDKYAMYKNGTVKMADLPIELLNEKQRQQVLCTLNQTDEIDKNALREFMGGFHYPMVHVDFESVMSAAPLFDGYKPFQQHPFQFSMHIQRKAGGELEHVEYLADPDTDCREELLETLLQNIPQDACVVAFNKSFEANILKNLGKHLPHLNNGALEIANNLIDLMVPFQKRWVYFWEFKGSYSIKAVLPVLCPELSYEDMEVANGFEAIMAYFRMKKAKGTPEYDVIRQQLLKYCGLDTLAMVRLFESLEGLLEAEEVAA